MGMSLPPGSTTGTLEHGSQGRVVRVNGPLVEVEGLDEVAVQDVVEIGHKALAAEVVSVRRGLVTAQVYEYTGGICVGDPALGQGHPLSAPPRSRPPRRDLRRPAPPVGRTV